MPFLSLGWGHGNVIFVTVSSMVASSLSPAVTRLGTWWHHPCHQVGNMVVSSLSLGWGCGGIWRHSAIILVLVIMLGMTSSLPLGWGYNGEVAGMLGVLGVLGGL